MYDELKEHIVKLGNDVGYPFSKEDVQQLMQEAVTSIQDDGELDDDQLEDVSGGSAIIMGVTLVVVGGVAIAATGVTGVFMGKFLMDRNYY